MSPILYRSNPQRTGFFDVPGLRKKPKALWRHKLKPRNTTHSLAVGESVVVAHPTGPHGVLGFAPDSGELMWSFDFPRGVWPTGASLVVGDAVYTPYTGVGPGGGVTEGMVVLDAASGRETGRLMEDRARSASPLLVDGNLVAMTREGVIEAFDARTGAPAWRTQPLGSIDGGSLALEGDVLVAHTTGTDGQPRRVLAVSPSTGALRWSRDLGNAQAPVSAIGHGSVYTAGRGDPTLLALDLESGEARWSYASGARLTAGLAVDAQRVYGGDDAHVVFALDVGSGELAWRYEGSGGTIHSDIVVAGDTLYAGSTTKLFALDAATGRELWSIPTQRNGSVAGSVVPVDGRLYVATSGELMALAR